jgi:hypothetical protein
MAATRLDLTAFTLDPLRADPDDLADAPIALTVAGAVVHREPTLAGYQSGQSRPTPTRHVTVATKPFGRSCGRIGNNRHSERESPSTVESNLVSLRTGGALAPLRLSPGPGR